MGRRIAYVSTYDASDKNQWSGLGYYIARSLELGGNTVNYVGDLKYLPSLDLKIRSRISASPFLNLQLPVERSIIRNFGKQAEMRIPSNVEIVFSPGTHALAYLETDLPKVIYTDATLAGMLAYYPEFNGWSNRAKKIAGEIENKALQEAALILFASDWAADTAQQFYNIPASKIKVIPFGANIDEYPNESEISNSILQRNQQQLHLLFCGIDWKRKGGTKALEIARYIRSRGIDVVLHIAGPIVKPIAELEKEEWIKFYGFLNKKNDDHLKTINALFTQAHFFIMASDAECYGLVYCEANAFGVPVLGQNTGGVSTIIKNGVNGYLFEIDATVEEYGNKLIDVWKEPDAYRQLALGAYNTFKKNLNWQVAGDSITKYLDEL